MMESKIATIANFRKLQCLPCKRRFTSMANLRRHMAVHVGWNRFRCKLCDFKCFAKCDCITHCHKMHNMQNDRTTMAELVTEISHNENTFNENIIMDVTNTKKTPSNSDIMDFVSSNQLETSLDLNGPTNSNMHIVSQIEDTFKVNEVIELKEDIENKDIDTKNDQVKITMENLSDYMTNYSPGKLESNPDLKRMIMEVILGTNDTNTVKQMELDKTILQINSNKINCTDHTNHADCTDHTAHTECKNHTDRTTHTDRTDRTTRIDRTNRTEHIIRTDRTNRTDCIDRTDTKDKNTTVFIAESKKKSSSTESLKYQRPMRKRIKPLNADFIYDLKKLASRKK